MPYNHAIMSLTISDAIAIRVLNKNDLLAGIGNELHLYTSDELTANQTLPIKLRGKIHGIEFGEELNADKLLVYGEKEFIFLERSTQFLYSKKKYVIKKCRSDIVLEIKLSENPHIAFIKTDISCEPMDGFEKLYVLWKCKFILLYRGYLTDWISSAKFLLDENQFILFTAHSIAIRLKYEHNNKTCRVLEKSSCSDKSTLYCSLVHGKRWRELVFFGGNAFGELLIWQPMGSAAPLLQRIPSHNGVIFSIDYNACENLLTTTSDDRSIRFWKVEQQTPTDWLNTKLIPLASGYGHIARVFQGRIIKFSNQPYAISVGEDSYICVWQINGTLIHKCRQQFNATIWNCDYDEETKTLYTVGSTGNILAYGLQNVLKEEITQPTKSVTIMPDIDCKDEYMAKVKFLTQNILIGITNQNRMAYVNIKDGIKKTWHIIDSYTGTKCTVLEVFKDTIAVCGYKRLTLFKFKESNFSFEKFYDDEILNGVIRAFNFLADRKFLICDDGGNCTLLYVSSISDKLNYNIENHNIILPKCKEPWLTTALLIDKYLVVSNRQGSIILFQWLESSNQFEQIDILKHVHGNLGATLLKLVEDTAEVTFFKSAGHDGTLKLIQIDNIHSKLSLVNRQIVPIAWIEALSQINNNELFLGFNDNHFTVWTKFHDFSLQVACGGGHRCWNFWIYEDTNNKERINLVFIKNKKVLLHQLELFNKPDSVIRLPIRNMWHVKACNVLKCITKNADTIIVSAGDDNLIKVSKFTKFEKELKQMAEIYAHISNIRALKILQIDEISYLICSGGGRAQLCITKLNTETFLVEELLNFTLKTQNNSVVNFQNNTKMYNLDPETRIMSLDILPLDADGYHIFIGCSDGFVRKYHLSSYWEICLITAVYYGKCILKVHLINELYLLVAATDGIIRFSSLCLTQVHLNLPHHASGINAFDMHLNEKKDELLLLTGGDDQDVVFTRLSWSNALKIAPNVIETVRFDSLHTAQVTAAQLSPCGRYSYSSGVDQMVFKLNLVTKEIVEQLSTCIPDVKGLELCTDDTVLIYGCGLQLCGFKR